MGPDHPRSRHQRRLKWQANSCATFRSRLQIGREVWGSDAIAAMLRALDIPYVALNPGASYRGLHDSLVNYLGNERPQMLLCLHEETRGGHRARLRQGDRAADGARSCTATSASCTHRWRSTTRGATACRCSLLGATGPLDAAKRRPWIDWIHTCARPGRAGARLHQVGRPACVGAGARSRRCCARRRSRRRRRAARRMSASTSPCRKRSSPRCRRCRTCRAYRRRHPPRPRPELVAQAAAMLSGASNAADARRAACRAAEAWKQRVALAETLQRAGCSPI